MAKRIQRTAPRVATAARPAPAETQAAAAPRRRARGRRVSDQVVTEFTVQLATLSEAGIPIVRALTVLQGQTRPGPFRDVVGDLIEDVSAGTPLSEAMEKHERAFDRLYASMVRAGEKAGVLDRILERLAEYRERAAEIRGKVVTAMVYPLVIVIVAVTVVSAVIVWVIPKFQQIFESFDVPLPGPTLLLLSASDFAVERWYVVFGIPIALLLLHGILMQRSAGYRYRVHGLLLRVPLLGGVLKQSLVASFSRTFGTLVQAGVPHIEALAIVRDTSRNDVVAAAVEDVRRTVREGEGIARPMEEARVFDQLVVSMVDVGEQTGELDNMLLRVADAYDRAVDRRVDRVFKVLEPALLIVMAVFVGFIVVALFLPLMRIMQTLGQP